MLRDHSGFFSALVAFLDNPHLREQVVVATVLDRMGHPIYGCLGRDGRYHIGFPGADLPRSDYNHYVYFPVPTIDETDLMVIVDPDYPGWDLA